MKLAERIRAGEATVVVVGLGRAGLPLALALAASGLRVMGLDSDEERRRAVQAGSIPFDEPDARALLEEVSRSGAFTAHTRTDEVVPSADVIVFCVGTPLGADLRPDFGQLRSALETFAPYLRPGQLLIQRSTVSPGTLQKVVATYLHQRIPDVAPGLLLAACPERIAEGKAVKELAELPEIVGGIDEASTEAAAALFRRLGPHKRIHLTDSTSAELGKLFTNVYRYVNFALANEFALLGEHYGVDTHRIIDLVNADYPRANIPRPGPAGGPCLSKDGYFLVEELTMPDFVLMAWKLNDSAPAHLIRRLSARLAAHGGGLAKTPVAVLGQTFKRDSDDLRQSPAVRMKEILSREAAEVRVHDPHLNGPTLEESLGGARAFVLATNHSYYETLKPQEVAELMEEPRVGIDAWGVLDRDAFADAGVDVGAFGVGDSL
jgi:UDP-N-acetyl-D-mannosaminuronic acid dehydrogenase